MGVVASWFELWLDRPVTVSSPHALAEAARRIAVARRRGLWADPSLGGGGGARLVRGHVSPDRVRLVAGRMSTRNSWRPWLTARIVAVPGGSRLVGSFGCHPAIRMLTALWLGGVLTFGLIGLIGTVAGRSDDSGDPLLVAGVAVGMATVGVVTVGLAGRAGLRDERFLREWLAKRLAD